VERGDGAEGREGRRVYILYLMNECSYLGIFEWECVEVRCCVCVCAASLRS
jgi:hypothetical protein